MYADSDVQNNPTNRGYNGQTNLNSYGSCGEIYRGRACGGRFYRGRGRDRYNMERDAYRYNNERDSSRIVCYQCDKLGHFAADFPDCLLKLQETQEIDNTETQNTDELTMHEVVFLNEKNILPEKYETDIGDENIWYLDNGASNHMMGDK